MCYSLHGWEDGLCLQGTKYQLAYHPLFQWGTNLAPSKNMETIILSHIQVQSGMGWGMQPTEETWGYSFSKQSHFFTNQSVTLFSHSVSIFNVFYF